MSLRANPGVVVSASGHALLLAAMLASFSHAGKFDDAQETIPVEMLTNAQFNQIMKGEKTAKLREKPAQRVEKLAKTAEPKPNSPSPAQKTDVPAPPPQAKPTEDPGRSEEAKPAPAPPPRPPEVAKAEAKPEPAKLAATQTTDAEAQRPKIEQKPEPRKAEAKPKPPEPRLKPDELAKLLEPQKTTAAKPEAARPKTGEETADPERKLDLGAISRLINKEAPQRKAATGRELQQVASLGSPTASAEKMSPSLWAQLDGILQDQYRHCWNYIGLAGQQKYVPQIHVQYAQDGALVGQPELLNPPSDPNLRSLADSALRAVRRCNPLRIPAQYQPFYNQWKGRIVRFDPEDML